MAVGKDTIQTLLRQRQDLRNALLELRQEIETLDAASLDLVSKNIKTKAPPKRQQAPVEPVGAAVDSRSEGSNDSVVTAPLARSAEKPPSVPPTQPVVQPPIEPEVKAEGNVPAVGAPVVSALGPAKALEAPSPAASAPPQQSVAASASPLVVASEAAPKSSIPADHPAVARQEPTITKAAETASAPKSTPEKKPEPAEENKVPPPNKAPLPNKATLAKISDSDHKLLLARAKRLALYFQGHPSPASEAQLSALDSAIVTYEGSPSPAAKKASYHALQSAYRNVASESYAAVKINGTTLFDSRIGAGLLWFIPLSITTLILAIFPLLLLGRTVTTQMFTGDFSSDIVWVFGAIAAYLWGAVGALTLLAVGIAVQVRRKQFDAGTQLSAGLGAALGGLIGAVVYMIAEVWLSPSNVTAEFGLDLMAFIGGMISWIIFAFLQRLTSATTKLIEPKNEKVPIKTEAKK